MYLGIEPSSPPAAQANPAPVQPIITLYLGVGPEEGQLAEHLCHELRVADGFTRLHDANNRRLDRDSGKIGGSEVGGART